MKLIQIVFSLALIIYVKGNQNDKDCKLLGHSIEERMRVFMFINSKPIIPIDDASLKSYCEAIKPITKEIKEYRKCVDAFSKQVITIIMPNLIKSIKKVCVTSTESTITNMQCATKQAQVYYRECFENFAIRTKYIAYKLTKSEELLSHLCCNFHSLRHCLLTKLSNICINPKADLAKYLTDYTSAIGQEVVQFSCAKYQTIKVCEEQGVVKLLKKFKASDVEKWKDEFFLIPLIKGTQMIVRN